MKKSEVFMRTMCRRRSIRQGCKRPSFGPGKYFLSLVFTLAPAFVLALGLAACSGAAEPAQVEASAEETVSGERSGEATGSEGSAQSGEADSPEGSERSGEAAGPEGDAQSGEADSPEGGAQSGEADSPEEGMRSGEAAGSEGGARSAAAAGIEDSERQEDAGYVGTAEKEMEEALAEDGQDTQKEPASAEQVFETAPQQEVGYEGMEPVGADMLKPGTYEISVDSSSSMFRITECMLEVSEDGMTAHMVMSGSAYAYIYAGTAAQAESAAEESWITDEGEEGGKNVFTYPVKALDMPLDCAAFSSNKQHWYDRSLVFRADSLPQEAWAEGFFVTAEELGLEDGSYECAVELSGGSGRASVASPCVLTVSDGLVMAGIVMSSSNYDYMVVDGEKYLPVNSEGNSEFEIPVAGFDRYLTVLADTTAMSVPYEIEYKLYFDSSSIEAR